MQREKGHVKMEAENAVTQLQATEYEPQNARDDWEPLAARKREGFFPRTFRWSTALSTP